MLTEIIGLLQRSQAQLLGAFSKRWISRWELPLLGLQPIGMREGSCAPLSMSALILIIYFFNEILHSFCTSDSRKNTFSKAHADDIEDFLNKWGKWAGTHGNKQQTISYYLLKSVYFL